MTRADRLACWAATLLLLFTLSTVPAKAQFGGGSGGFGGGGFGDGGGFGGGGAECGRAAVCGNTELCSPDHEFVLWRRAGLVHYWESGA